MFIGSQFLDNQHCRTNYYLLTNKAHFCTMMTMTRYFRIFALLSVFAPRQVESNDIMVTCSVDEGTRNIDDCDLPPIEGATTNVWHEVSELMRDCTQLGMEQGYGKKDWTLYSLEPRRNLRQQEERELGKNRCQGTCYSPWSSCCLLWSGFCAGICGNGCSCDYRRLSEADEIENVLATNNGKDAELSNKDGDGEHVQRRTMHEHRVDVIANCVDKMEELRTSLLAQQPPNLCLAASTDALGNPLAVTCNAFSSVFV